jgi:TonB family protein
MGSSRLVQAVVYSLSLAAVLCGYVSVAVASIPTLDPNNPPHLGTEYYPPESVRLHEEGKCKVKLMVAADGTIRDVTLTQSTGYARLDDACLKAFASGGLLPATLDGKPVDGYVEVPITWSIESAPQVATPRPRIDPKNPPRIGQDHYPAESVRLHEEGKCIVSVTVTAGGKIRNIKLTQSTGFPRLDRACLKAFSHGGLLPATADGKPIDSTTEIPIVWSLTTQTRL